MVSVVLIYSSLSSGVALLSRLFLVFSPQAVNYPYVEDGTISRSGTLTRSTHTQVVADSPGTVMKEHMLYIWNPEFEVSCPFMPTYVRKYIRHPQRLLYESSPNTAFYSGLCPGSAS